MVVLAPVWGLIGMGAETVVPNPGLEGAIRTAVGKLKGDLTVSDLESPTEIEARGRNIEDLTGLECAVKLKEIVLFDNRVSDLFPLAGVSALEELSIG
ncbi:MAG: hypothetical protein PHZ21_04395 [Candidatus Bipolaricaulis sp.]|nr:hypothetical protein [Candidatus Bipolaricaulis sp.]MDY0392486.1 hypothetical protein [Candidatus Bipolaricaulis sp.]